VKPQQAIDKLTSLKKTQGWQIVEKVMDQEILTASFQLSENRDMTIDEIHFKRGAMWAARQLKELPDKLILKYRNDVALEVETKEAKKL
tara:strand:+ start:3207 stop:3473 length:267 start_codon:yes stop_codon:yes gene_type:complete